MAKNPFLFVPLPPPVRSFGFFWLFLTCLPPPVLDTPLPFMYLTSLHLTSTLKRTYSQTYHHLISCLIPSYLTYQSQPYSPSSPSHHSPSQASQRPKSPSQGYYFPFPTRPASSQSRTHPIGRFPSIHISSQHISITKSKKKHSSHQASSPREVTQNLPLPSSITLYYRSQSPTLHNTTQHNPTFPFLPLHIPTTRDHPQGVS